MKFTAFFFSKYIDIFRYIDNLIKKKIMENSKNQRCEGLPHFCSAGMQAPKVSTAPETKIQAHAAPDKMNGKQKPWSVFGELYWI